MNTDLIERLRNRRLAITGENGKICDTPDDDCIEAADEIERLTTAVNMLLDGTAMRDAEIERLRDALEQAVDDFAEGHCVCEQTKQMCIAALATGERDD